jgi:hemerythrin
VRIPADLQVGFEEIDGQHGAILAALEEAQRALPARDLPALRAALAGLGDLLVAHFAAEEAFMAESLYPDRTRHKAAHDLFMQDLAQLVREVEGGGLGEQVSQWVNTRLPEWMKFHIRVNDLPLGRFLAARRFRPRPGSAAGAKPRVS